MAGPGPIPIEGDRDAWCRERMEFVLAVVGDVDRDSLKAQLDQCETEDEAEGILQSLLWLSDYNNSVRIMEDVEGGVEDVEGDVGVVEGREHLVGNPAPQRFIRVAGVLQGNQPLQGNPAPHNEIFVNVLQEEARPNGGVNEEGRIEVVGAEEEGMIDFFGTEDEGRIEVVGAEEEGRIEVASAEEEGRIEVANKEEEGRIEVASAEEEGRIDYFGAEEEPRLRDVLNGGDGEREEEQHQSLIERGEHEGVNHGDHSIEEIRLDIAEGEENNMQNLPKQVGAVDPNTHSRQPVNEDQYYQRPDTSRNQNDVISVEDVVAREATNKEGSGDWELLGSGDLRDLEEVEEVRSEFSEAVGQGNVPGGIEHQLSKLEQHKRKLEHQDSLLEQHNRNIEQHNRNLEQQTMKLEHQEQEDNRTIEHGHEREAEQELFRDIDDSDIEEDIECLEDVRGRTNFELGAERKEGKAATVIQIDDDDDDDDVSVSNCSVIVMCGDDTIELIDIAEVTLGEDTEANVDDDDQEDREEFEDSSVVSLDELFSLDDEDDEEETEYQEVDEGVSQVEDDDGEETEYQELGEGMSQVEDDYDDGEETEYQELDEGMSQVDDDDDDYHTPQQEFEEDRSEENDLMVVREVREEDAAGGSATGGGGSGHVIEGGTEEGGGGGGETVDIDEVEIVQDVMMDEDEQLARRIAADLAEEERMSLEADERLARMIYQEMQRQESEQELQDAELARRLASEDNDEAVNLNNDRVDDNEDEIEIEPVNQGTMEWNELRPIGGINQPQHGLIQSHVQRAGGPFAMAYQGEAYQGDQVAHGQNKRLIEARRELKVLHQRMARSREPELNEDEEMVARGGLSVRAAQRIPNETINDEVIAQELSEEGATSTWQDMRGDHEIAQRLEQEEEQQNQEMEEKLRRDEEIARQIEKEEMEAQDQELNKKTAQFADLLTLFPDADPAYLQERCEGPEQFEQVVESLFELQKSQPKDPRIYGHLTRRKLENLSQPSTSRDGQRQQQQQQQQQRRLQQGLTMMEEEDAMERLQGAMGRRTYECTICFEEEVPAREMASCSGTLYSHHFCIECVRKHVAAQIGLGNNIFQCMNGYCEAEFTTPTLSRVMEPQVLKKVEERRQTEEVVRARIEDLVTCPFCCYMVIMPDQHNRLFECRNPECLKDSCRLCREPSHIPLRCDEVERDNQRDARILLENSMAEAMIRTCPNCNKRFIIESGCNKMTCSCGVIMCYVCKQIITNSYNHFEQNRNVASNKCPLYSNPQELHVGEVREAVERVRQEMDPNISLVHDPTKDLP